MMFSINIYLRLALMGVLLIGGVALGFVWGFWWSFPFILAGIILTVGYFLLGTVQSAAMMLQTGDYEAANQRLDMTKFPQWLYVANRAYFFLLKGTIFSQQKDYVTAEENYIKAQKIGLPSDNEKAMVLLALTNFRLMKNNWPAAENFYRQLKTLKVTEPMIKAQIKEFDEAMKQKGQVKAAMSRPGFRNTMGGGGKRPQPKNR